MAPLCSLASTVTGSNPTEVSTHVDGSLAGSTAAPEQQSQQSDNRGGQSQGPSMAGGMPLADLSGLPFMLVGPPQSYSLAPRGKLRSLSGEVSAPDSGGGGGMSNVSPQAGNGNGGTASVGSVGSAPQQVPEPFTILLAAPALAVAIRRRMRRRA